MGSSSEKKDAVPSKHFASVLYRIVDMPSFDSMISWGRDGKSFIVWDADKACKKVLPYLCLHSIPFFIHDLGAHGFKKVEGSGEGEFEYAHENFVRGKPELTDEIQKAYMAQRLVIQQFIEMKDVKEPGWLENRKAIIMADKAARDLSSRLTLNQ